MLKSLRLKLTITFTVLFSLVFGTIMGIALLYELQIKKEEHYNNFSIAVNNAFWYMHYFYNNDPPPELHVNYPYYVVISNNEELIPVNNLMDGSSSQELIELANEGYSSYLDNFYIYSTIPEADAGAKAETNEQALNDNSGDSQFYEAYPTPDTIYIGTDTIADGAPLLIEAVYEPYYLITDKNGKTYYTHYEQSFIATEAYWLDIERQAAKGQTLSWEINYDDPRVFQYTLYVFEDTSYYTSTVLKSIIKYVLLYIVIVMVLFAASHYLSRKILYSTEQSIQKQADFIAAASHELRTPLANITSCLQASERTSEKEKYISIAGSEANRMRRLTNDLLVLAGGNSSRWKIQKKPFELDTLLISIAEKYETNSKAKAKEIKIVVKLPEEILPKVSGDEYRIHQIIDILVNNAIEYSHNKSNVTLGVSSKKNRIEVFVKDHGIGIASEEKEKLFDKFYRSDKSRTNSEHFGLGLSVAKELAMLHSGNIFVQDTIGGGSTFILELPIENKRNKQKD